MWTQFMDMHSGGGSKEKWNYIYIEAPEKDAVTIFYNMFGHNPHRVTCTCCGEDYSVTESETLEEATGYERGCELGYFNKDGVEISEDEAWIRGEGYVDGCYSKYVERRDKKYSYKTYVTLDEYLKKDTIRVIYADEILPQHRTGSVPKQGYVWVD
jgi:hypothetical protein